MAVLAAAQLLDELMGRHRNSNPNEKIKKPNWEDPEVGILNQTIHRTCINNPCFCMVYRIYFAKILIF